MTNYIYGLIAVILVLVGVEQYGEHRIQVRWDKDIAVRDAVTKQAIQNNEENISNLKEQFKKDKKDAESEAGKRAVAKYLRSIGVLPDGLPMRKCDSGQADIPKGADSTASEYGLAERITQLAERAIEDARRVEMCAKWATRENLPVE